MFEAARHQVRKHGPATVAAIAALYATIYGLPAIFSAAGFPQAVKTGIVFPDVPKWLLVASIAILSPLIEELVFRKWLIKLFRALTLPFWPAAILSTALWVATHLPVTAVAVSVYSVSGLILCWLLRRSGELWPCIAAHAAYNAVPATLILIYH